MNVAKKNTESYILFHKFQLYREVLDMSLQESTKELTKTPTRKVTASVPSVERHELIGDFSTTLIKWLGGELK